MEKYAKLSIAILAIVLILGSLWAYQQNYFTEEIQAQETEFNSEATINPEKMQKLEIEFKPELYPAPQDNVNISLANSTGGCGAGGDHFIAYHFEEYNDNLNTTVAYDKNLACGYGKYLKYDGYFIWKNNEFIEVSKEGFNVFISQYNLTCKGCLKQYGFYGD